QPPAGLAIVSGDCPADLVGRRTVKRTPRRLVLTEAEASALLNAGPPTRGGWLWPARQVAYHLCLDAGLRRGDLRTLRVGQVRLGGLRPFLELAAADTKSGQYETVPITES